MKIEHLVNNLEQNTEKQSKIMSEQMQSVMQQHLKSYNELLDKNRQQTEKILNEHLQLIESHRNELKKATNYKMMIGGGMGFLLAIILGLGIFSLYLAKTARNQHEEIAEIQQNIEMTSLQAQAFAKVTITQNKDKSIWITAKNPKKSEAGKLESNGKPTLKLE